MISILTPHTQERENYLRECYESLLNQHCPWEWLIEIDGEGEVDSEISRDGRVSVSCSGSVLGPANCRNLALGKARGEWILSLDDDDLLYPDSLGDIRDYMNSKPDLPAGIGQGFLLENGKLQPWIRDGYRREDIYPPGEDIPPGAIYKARQKFGTHALSAGPTFWRREALLSLGGWPALRGSEDSLLLFLANKNHAIAHPDIPYFIYRQHENQESRSEKIQQLRQRNSLLIKEIIEE